MKKTGSENFGRRSIYVGKGKDLRRRRLFLKQLISHSIPAVIIFFSLAAFSPARPLAPTIEIAAVGDILLARGVEKRIERFGAGYPFEKVRDILINADLAFGNLENPLAASCEKTAKKFSFRAKPEYSKILRAAGLDVLSLANNHSLDCGQKGLFETIENLTNENLRSAGAGKTRAATESPVYFEIKKIKIAFLGFTAIAPVKTAERSPNVAFATIEKVTRAISAARRKADVVVASFHWGTEYVSRPNAEQVRLANAAVEAGADVVLGHHPHVLQGFQLIDRRGEKRRALVAYSLGNFVFDSPANLVKKTAESVILKMRFDKNGFVDAEIVPVMVEDRRPAVVAGEKNRRLILTRLSALSCDFKTKVTEGRLVKEEKNPVGHVEQAN